MRRALYFMALAAGLVVTGGIASAQRPAPAGSPAWSVTDCQTCHEQAVGPSFLHTRHAGLEQSCASCHPGAARGSFEEDEVVVPGLGRWDD